MDALEQFDMVHDRRSTAQAKLVEAIEMMAEGYELKRAQIRTRHPDLSDAETFLPRRTISMSSPPSTSSVISASFDLSRL